jgi:hypothetical protein
MLSSENRKAFDEDQNEHAVLTLNITCLLLPFLKLSHVNFFGAVMTNETMKVLLTFLIFGGLEVALGNNPVKNVQCFAAA